MKHIGQGELHLWYSLTEDLINRPELIAAYQTLLTPAELSALAKRCGPEVKMEFLVTRALARAVLAAYTGMPPSVLEFVVSTFGRPHLAHYGLAERLDFNISHSKGVVIIAVTNGPAVGVDVEALDRDLNLADLLSAAVFSDEEKRWILQQERQRRFLQLWTLKEAWAKARGYGLSDRVRDAHFNIDPDGKIKFSLPAEEDGSQTAWAFEQKVIEERFLLSVAVLYSSALDFSSFRSILLRPEDLIAGELEHADLSP
jgi:4'-phosphopantetheinyl transferase